MRTVLSVVITLILTKGVLSQTPEYSDTFYLGGSSISGVLGFDVIDKDILIYTETEIKWFENRSGGSFSNAQTFFELESPVVDIASGDLDSNGKVDVVLIQEAKPEELIVFWDANSGSDDVPMRYQLETRGSSVAYASYAMLDTYEQPGKKTKLYLKYTRNTVTNDSEIIRELTFTEKQLTEKQAVEGIENDFYRSGGFEFTDFNNDGITDFVIPITGSNSFDFDFLISNPDTNYTKIDADFGGQYNVRSTILSDILFIDVDGDGFKDVITSTYGQIVDSSVDPALPLSYLTWYKNTDNNSFESGTPLDSLRGGYSDIYLYDVNQDGRDDLVAQSHIQTPLANPEDQEALKTYWYEKNADSGFGERKELPGYYSEVEIADMDNNGRKDLVGLYYDEISWHKNEGTAVGGARPVVSSEIYLSDTDVIKSEDVDGDNLNDIVIGSSQGIYWYKNQGDLKFSEINDIDSEMKDVKEIEFTDINGDGLQDMIVLTSDYYYSSQTPGSFTNFRFYIFKNTGNGFSDGELMYEQPYSSEVSTNIAFSVGDYDADEDIDITFQEGKNIYWFENEEGSFPAEPALVDSYEAESSTQLLNEEIVSFRADDRSGDELFVLKTVYGRPPFISYTPSAVIYSFSADSSGFFKLQEVEMSNLEGYKTNLTIHTGNFDNDEDQEVLVSDRANLFINSEVDNLLYVDRSIIDKPQDSTSWNATPLNGTWSSHLNSPHTGITTADVDNDGTSEILSVNRRYRNINLATPTTYSSGSLRIHGINDESELIHISTIDTLRDGYTSLIASDLNNDSYPEIIAALYNDGRMAIYGGNEASPPVSNENELSTLPEKVTLAQNYPNPFNPITTIKYSVPSTGFVELKVYNLLGQLVQTLVDERKASGAHQVNFDASSLASGIYIYRLQSGNTVLNKKMVLLK